MRLLRVLFFLGLLVPVLSPAALVWETQRVALTAKAGDKEAVALFPFKNTGPDPVTFGKITTSCECTAADVPKQVYAPGESGAVRAVFTLGDRTGPQDRVITVHTGEPRDAVTQLRLLLDIPAPLTWSARMVQWSVGGSPDEKFIEVAANGGGRIAAVEIRSIASAQVTAQAEPVDGGAKYWLAIKPTQLDKAGTVAINGVVRLEGGAEQAFTVYALIR